MGNVFLATHALYYTNTHIFPTFAHLIFTFTSFSTLFPQLQTLKLNKEIYGSLHGNYQVSYKLGVLRQWVVLKSQVKRYFNGVGFLFGENNQKRKFERRSRGN